MAFLAGSGALPTLDESGFAKLQREAPDYAWSLAESESEFLTCLPAAEIVLVWRFKREWQEPAARLNLISTPAAGREWLEAAPRPGLEIWFGSFHGVFMAETVAGLMLALSRGIKDSQDYMAEGGVWPRERVAFAMRPLRGSRATILGFGHIGKWIGKLLKPFGVALRGVNRSDLSRPAYFEADDMVRPLADLDSLLPDTDHLILALPGDSGVDGIVDARRLDLLPRRACVYNVG
ncbi:MAG: hypothetical protein LBV15_00725, partial [Planctomycetota bacterium]|nr:hypothetical protein [Planctomycetota bacterium]